MQKCEFSYTEITFLYGYSSKSMNSISAFFREHIWELILYTVFNIEVLQKRVKY